MIRRLRALALLRLRALHSQVIDWTPAQTADDTITLPRFPKPWILWFINVVHEDTKMIAAQSVVEYFPRLRGLLAPELLLAPESGYQLARSTERSQQVWLINACNSGPLD